MAARRRYDGCMSAIVQELLRRHDLPGVMAELNDAILDEARRRAEFVEWLDDHTYAEFIRGEVVVHSPERWGHGRIEDNLKRVLQDFVRHELLGEIAGNKLVRFPRDDYIPDLNFWPKVVSDTFTDETTIFPVPELIVEILSESTAENDRGVKYEAYAAGGVREYFIVDPEERVIEQHELDPATGTFRLRAASRAQSKVISRVLDGLSFAADAAFDDAANRRAIESLRK
jgi:Uma2 family endonuclease